MEDIFLMREYIIVLFKKYESPALFILKTVLGIVIFSLINTVGAPSMLNNLAVVLLLGLLTSVLPAGGFFILLLLVITARLFFTSIELSILVFLLMLAAYLFYVRIFPKQSLLIIATVMGYYLKIPYVVPIFAGLYIGLSGICPILIGIYVWHFMPVMNTFSQTNTNGSFSVLQMPETFMQMYTAFFNQLMSSQSLIVSGLIFSIATLLVYIISLMSFDYSGTVAIITGGVVMLIGFFIALIVMDIAISPLQLMLGDLAATGIMLGVHFFDVALDYSKAERVQFQDGENYYYVKVVPKVRKKQVKKKIEEANEKGGERRNHFSEY